MIFGLFSPPPKNFISSGSCLSSSSRRCSPSNFSFPPSLPSYVILSKVGKKERGSRRMEIVWYRTGVLVEKNKKYLSNFYFFNMGSCLSSSCRCSPVSSSNFSLPPSLHSYVILNKVGKRESGSHRMEVNWYKKLPAIEEEEILIS